LSLKATPWSPPGQNLMDLTTDSKIVAVLKAARRVKIINTLTNIVKVNLQYEP